MLHKGVWVATLLGTLLGVDDMVKVRYFKHVNIIIYSYVRKETGNQNKSGRIFDV